MKSYLSVLLVLFLVIIHYSISGRNDEKFCGTPDFHSKELMEVVRGRGRGRKPNYGQLTFRLSVFYDISLFNKYQNNAKAIEEFIYRTVSSADMSFKHSNIRQIADISLEITEIGFYKHKISETADGNQYRGDFCRYIKNSAHHKLLASSVLLTGHNFRSKFSNSSTTQGLAHLAVACDWGQGVSGYGSTADACALVEGRQFKAAFILAHELGHTLGMHHDEFYKCGSNDIMSESTGDGKTRWSHCSVAHLANYLRYLKSCSYWCLTPDQNATQGIPSKFKWTSVDEQCRTALGPTFHQYMAWNRKSDVCHRIDCTDNTFVIPIHPAIENTPCSPGNVCNRGHYVNPYD